jgi:hypothetical protein
MDWAIPIQTFQVENVQLGSLLQGSKPLTPLAYKDSDFSFPSLILLLPKLKVKSYDSATGRLIISLADFPQILSKLMMLQDMLLTAVYINQQRWFPKSQMRKLQELRGAFQPMLFEQEMHLYCPCQTATIQGPSIFKGGAWSKNSLQPGYIQSDSTIRLVLRIQGISFHIHPLTGQWSGKFRLQHKILGVLVSSN